MFFNKLKTDFPQKLKVLLPLWLVICISTLAHNRLGDYVMVNDAKLWYETEGSGEPLVLVSGGPGFSHVYFKPHFSKLSDDFLLIYFDGIGRGRSDFADSPSAYSIDRDVDDLEGLRQALEIEKWHVYGHSYGGIVAQQYALKHQEHLSSLVLANTMHSAEMWQQGRDNYYREIKNQYPEEWETINELAKQGKKESSPEMRNISIPTLPLIYFYDISNFQKLQSDSLPWNSDVYFSIVGEEFFYLSPSLQDMDFRPALYKIRVPMLVIAGRYDRIAMPRFQVQYKVYAPHADFMMFEHSGHFPFLEETAKHRQVLEEFLKRD